MLLPPLTLIVCPVTNRASGRDPARHRQILAMAADLIARRGYPGAARSSHHAMFMAGPRCPS
jgi:hypothetical protein